MSTISTSAEDGQKLEPGRELLFLPIIERPETESDDLDIVKLLLAEQQSLTAVEDFSTAHDDGLPAQSQYYSKLLPASSPGPGQQFAFEVDLDCCSGCKACITACHSMNGLDEQETWRDVGLLMGGTTSNPVMQHVTTACHHCIEPACMIACPVDAYEKNPVTGIVKHLDDQCFGCQYCTLACPYDVPKYHADKGIVRKCDMCSDRLTAGEAPACVQACPHEAIAIRIVNTNQVIENAEVDHFLPAAPDPQFTLPTTNYKTSKVYPRNMLPADYYSVNPQHPHWPLIVMLVLTQLSVGAYIVGMFLDQFMDESVLPSFRKLHATNALIVGLLALASSTMHLGRPQYAFRAIVGLRHSWLSREILAFGAFAGAAFAYAAVCWWLPDSESLRLLSWGVAISGFAGVFCSVMIYVFTGREFWSFSRTFSKFVMTSAVLGLSGALVSVVADALISGTAPTSQLSSQTLIPLLQVLIVTGIGKLLLEASLFRHLLSRRETALKRSSRLMTGPLRRSTWMRFATGLLGSVALPLLNLNELSSSHPDVTWIAIGVAFAFVLNLTGELLERYQFFSACAVPRMPGRLNP